MQVMLWAFTASAAPVIWLEPPTAEQRTQVERAADGTSTTLDALATRLGAPERPGARIDDVEATVERVRAYETRLDGEKIIMDDLQTAIAKVEVIRDTGDRDALFSALAYQGFAVHRFFGASLEGEAAADWRTELDGTVVPTPWLNAVAVAPDREITAYDIAEAPQRIAFTAARTASKAALPGGLRFDADAGEVFLDGVAVDATDTTLRIPPGRHYTHLVVDGQIVAHQTVTLTAGGSQTVTLKRVRPEVDLADLAVGDAVPTALEPTLAAAGGELWVARPGPKVPAVLSISKAGVRTVEIQAPASQRTERDDGGLYLAVGLGGGWLSSGDFYTQDPNVPRTVGTVNSAAFEGGVGVGMQLGLLRAEAGLDVLYHPGEHHVAKSGDSALRFRPTPVLAVGLPWIQAMGGYLFPYHGMIGARGTLPLPAGLEVRANLRIGLPGKLSYDDGTQYSTRPVYNVGAGITYRIGPGGRSSVF